MDKECDIICIMEQVRKSKNFLKNYLTREQKILMKYDHSNIIDGEKEDDTDFEDIA